MVNGLFFYNRNNELAFLATLIRRFNNSTKYNIFIDEEFSSTFNSTKKSKYDELFWFMWNQILSFRNQLDRKNNLKPDTTITRFVSKHSNILVLASYLQG